DGDARGLLRAATRREAVARGFELEEALMASLAVGAALRLTGRAHEALARSRRVWADAQRAVLPQVSVEAGYWLARSLAFMGELFEAEQVAAQVSELVRRVGDEPRARHRVVRVVAHVRMERGEGHEALPLLEQAVSDEPNQHQRIALYGDCAVWRARFDGPAGAAVVRAHTASGRRASSAVRCPRCGAELLLLAAEALARIGERDAARATLDEWDGLARAQDELDRVIRLQVGALVQEEPLERAGGLESALATARASPYRLAALWVWLDLGLTLAEAGDERAVDGLAAVAVAAQEKGAETVRMMAERGLRQLGVRPWRRGMTGAPLTAREEEIARLVAAGATNREVADALYLSPKTIERHLANVFRKLDVRNRTELAARLADGVRQIEGSP
ncbi:MAG TPA: LuxR C-terminal-related transcriptional regulator, partial [Egibacteraceae bacterium]|nr:LuxR C-terminal-related transcriptional regulator [Egibacteraceae bacterium]